MVSMTISVGASKIASKTDQLLDALAIIKWLYKVNVVVLRSGAKAETFASFQIP